LPADALGALRLELGSLQESAGPLARLRVLGGEPLPGAEDRGTGVLPFGMGGRRVRRLALRRPEPKGRDVVVETPGAAEFDLGAVRLEEACAHRAGVTVVAGLVGEPGRDVDGHLDAAAGLDEPEGEPGDSEVARRIEVRAAAAPERRL